MYLTFTAGKGIPNTCERHRANMHAKRCQSHQSQSVREGWKGPELFTKHLFQEHPYFQKKYEKNMVVNEKVGTETCTVYLIETRLIKKKTP